MAISGTVLPNGRYLQISDSAGDTIVGDKTLSDGLHLDDEMTGRGGNDTLRPGLGFNIVDGGSGDDTIVSSNSIPGVGQDIASGGTGQDRFTFELETIAAGQMHSFNGGDGIDTLGAAYIINPQQKAPMQVRGAEVSFGPNSGLVRIKDIEHIEGTVLDDVMRPNSDVATLTGNPGDDRLYASRSATDTTLAGGSGNDILVGNKGDDVLYDGDFGLIGSRPVPMGYLDNDLMKGGDGNDTFYSYSGADKIVGRKGHDTIYAVNSGSPASVDIRGGSGDDRVRFDYGQIYVYAPDTLKRLLTIDQSSLTAYSVDGGSGTDTLNFRSVVNTAFVNSGNLALGITLDLGSGLGTERGTGTNGSFVAKNFEDVEGTERSDVILGDYKVNTIVGHDGADELRGRGGDDILYGDGDFAQNTDTKDRLFGGAGHDSLFGGSGNDMLSGGKGSDWINGGSGDDKITGGAGDDSIFGGSGDDKITGGAGDDSIFGGSGDDKITGGAGDDFTAGGSGDDKISGGAGNDWIVGGSGDDKITGEAGSDTIDGNSGADTIDGSQGNDTIAGDQGNDTLIGGRGNDLFVFTDGHGKDVITDFDATQNAEDIGLFNIAAISNFIDLRNNHMVQVASDVVIDTGTGTITLIRVSLSNLLDGNDFLF